MDNKAYWARRPLYGQVTIQREERGVLVNWNGGKFVISMKNAANMDWNEADKRYCGELPNAAQAEIICRFSDEINTLFAEIGGGMLDAWYWGENGILYYGGNSGVHWVSKNVPDTEYKYWHHIRPIINLG